MPKWCKTILGILLLPLCLGSTQALIKVLKASTPADIVWIALASGAACWVVIYLLLPKPMWVYVFGHELTHALWGWLFGAKIERFKSSAQGGHVVLSTTNFLVTLAPYFFPLYAVALCLLFAAGNRLWNWTAYEVWFHLLVGAAYAFHLTLTFHVLQTKQSDLSSQGYLFSAAVIWLGNVSILLISVPLLTAQVHCLTALKWSWTATAQILQKLAQWSSLFP